MTNKQLIKEGILLITAFIAIYLYFALSIPRYETLYLSDIYVGGRPLDSSAGFSFGQLFSVLAFALALAFLFPLLFVIHSIRAVFQRFTFRTFNIYLLFTSLISFLVTLLLLFIYNFFSPGWTIYPPLSALPQVERSSGFSGISFALMVFLALHLVILVIAVRQLFKKASL